VPESKKRYWEPAKSAVERVPNELVVSHEQPGIMPAPHWHAQVEMNYVFRGSLEYQMRGHKLRLKAGDFCLFWGGLPHQVVDTSDDPFFLALHLPLVHFFRLRLPADLAHKLTHGATLVTSAEDGTDSANCARWISYLKSPDRLQVEHAINEILLRIERVRYEPFFLVEPKGIPERGHESADQHPFVNIAAICDFVAGNFRRDIDCTDIAASVDIHPKYAMNLFKRSTGMTLNEYLSLLRLSYAQALLMKEDANILTIAAESGFGSLSNFNKCFRRMAGMSPTNFRRDLRIGPNIGH